MNEINYELIRAEESKDVSSLVYFMRADWYLTQPWKQKQNALNSYIEYFVAMENRACLRTDDDRIDFAERIINTITKP